ncbi:MAG: radical SAM protein [Candidatus Thiodiazotropha sp.]
MDVLRCTYDGLDAEHIERAISFFEGDLTLPRPITIHFDLTFRCSARCIHCKQWTWPTIDELQNNQVLKLIDIFASWGVKTITFGGGNPLLASSLGTALKHAKGNNIDTAIISEGVFSSDFCWDELASYISWIRFSIDGHIPEIHDAIRGKKGLFNAVVDNIKSIKKRSSRTVVGINCLLQKKNFNYIDEICRFASKLNVDALNFKVPHGGTMIDAINLTDSEWEDVAVRLNNANEYGVRTNSKQLSHAISHVFGCRSLSEGKPLKAFYSTRKLHCYAVGLLLVCDAQGDLYPCDYLQYDTRPWGGKHGTSRKEFVIGNLLRDYEGVKDSIRTVLIKAHEAPYRKFDECFSCTRFWQLNEAVEETISCSAINKSILKENPSNEACCSQSEHSVFL